MPSSNHSQVPREQCRTVPSQACTQVPMLQCIQMCQPGLPRQPVLSWEFFPLFPSSQKASDEVVYLCRDLLLSELAFKDSIIKLSDKRFFKLSDKRFSRNFLSKTIWGRSAMIYFTQYANQGILFLVSQLVFDGGVIHHVLIYKQYLHYLRQR